MANCFLGVERLHPLSDLPLRVAENEQYPADHNRSDARPHWKIDRLFFPYREFDWTNFTAVVSLV